jgi:hypothetical protein
MWRLNPPAIDIPQLYEKCIEGIRDEELLERLQLALPTIQQFGTAYVQAATAGQLHMFPPALTVEDVTTTEMSWVYDNRMVRSNSPGRTAYDQIMSAPINSRCPLCGHRRVSTLDHHLPKSRYAAFTILPFNLVPACKDCNGSKLHLVPSGPEQSTLHPYFDDVESGRWLKFLLMSRNLSPCGSGQILQRHGRRP